MSRRRAGKNKNPETIAEHFASMTRAAIRSGDRNGYSRLVDGVVTTSAVKVSTRRGTYHIFHDRSWLWVQLRYWMPGESIAPPCADTQPCGIGGAGCVCSQRCKRVTAPRKPQPVSPSARSAASQEAIAQAQIGKDLNAPVWRN